MLGGGNPVGGNPAGIGTSINSIGNHVYGYSGLVDCSTALTRLLKFATGNSYLKVKFNPVYFTETTGENAVWEIFIDGQVIYHVEATSSSDYTPFTEIEIVIPSYAEVEIKAKAASGNRNLGCIIAGRVY